MQIDQQIQSDIPPVIAPSAQSDKSKSKRGGKRPGAGRKPNLAKRLASVLKPMTVAEILQQIDVPGVFRDIFKNGSRPLKLQAVNTLWDRALGKPKQDVSVSGGLIHAHTSDPFLAALPKEGLEALAPSYDEVLAKYTTPVLDVAQDGPHNQIESKPAIVAAEVDWAECLSCNATGWTGNGSCEQCGGAGWLFVRGKALR
jgi:hypothetical protein